MDGLMQSRAWRFDRFLLDLPNGGLFCIGDDGVRTPVPIGSRALEVLLTLVARSGELVAKQALMDAVWPGVAVEDKNLTVQISTLRRVLDEGRPGESCIQTVPGRGYRLAVPTTRVALPSSPPPGPAPQPVPRRRWRRWSIAIPLGLGAVALAGLAILLAPGPAPAPRLSVVMLPFAGLGSDRRDDQLARAITDDLTTDLSRVPGMSVVAHRAADPAQDPRQIGREAGVRYVVEGSVRQVGGRLRVNGQIISAESGTHLWAERLDLDGSDPGAGQEEAVRRLSQALNVAMTDLESARSQRERPASPDTFDLLVQARSIGLHTMGPREHAERLALAERALQLDPRSVVAMTIVATELVRLSFNETGDQLRRAASLVGDATAINPNDPLVLDAKAFLLFGQRRFTEAAAAFERVLAADPGASSAYNQLGLCLIFTGHAEQAIPVIETAIRRGPRSAFDWSRYDSMGFALLMLGRDQEAIVWTRRALAAISDGYPVTRAHFNLRLAAAYARLGQADEAHRAVAEANRIWPYGTVRMHWPDDPSPAYSAQIAQFQAALRLAGHRDHADEDADFGLTADDRLRADLAGQTPTSVPGATLIHTAGLERLLRERTPIVIDPLLYSWGRSIPGAIGLAHAGVGGSLHDTTQDRLRQKMAALTKGDRSAPIVAVGFNAERFDGRNVALRLAALGYTDVYWYRGGREAWEVAGLPETSVKADDW